MEDTLVPIFGMLSTFGSIFGIFYLFFMTRNKERMAIIEKGVSADIFNQNKKYNVSYWTLKIGMLSIGIGLGLAISIPMCSWGYNEWQQITLIWALVLLFGGLGLFASFLIERKLNKNNK